MKSLVFLFIVVLLEWLGYGIILPLIPFLGQKFEVTKLELGLLASIFSLSAFIASPFLGWLSDKYSKANVISLCLFISFLSMVVGIYANSYATLLFSRFLAGIGAASIGVIYSYISSVSNKEERLNTMSMTSTAMAIGLILGPVIGGVQMSKGLVMSQMQDSFLYASIILLLAFVFSFFLLKKETENVEIEKFSKSQIVSNVINVDTIAIMFIMGVVAFFLACMMIYFPLWSQEVLGWEAKENGYAIGFIGFIVALTQAIFIPLVGSKIGSNNLLIVAMIAFMLSGIFMVIGLTNLACILGLIFYALGFGLSSPLLASLLTINTKGPVGLVYGISESIKNLSEFIGPLFIGLFLDKYSLNIMFYGLIFFSIICFLISYKIKFRYNAQGI